MAGPFQINAWPAVASAAIQGGEVTISKPALGEQWHGTVTATPPGRVKVRVHSYTPRGGGLRRPMRHTVTVNAADIKPGQRRIPVRAGRGTKVLRTAG